MQTSLKRRLPDHDALLADDDHCAAFCANPDCALHVPLTELKALGGGGWVCLSDGRIFGRSRFGDRALCDACGTRRGPIELPRRRL